MALYVTAFDGMGSGEDSLGGALQNLAGIEASDIMHIANDFLNQEGVNSLTDDDFEVTAAGTDMNVDVDTGVAYVQNDAWSKATSVTKYWRVESDAVEEVTLDPSDATLDRIDLIILQINDAASADDEASNVATVTKVTGTPAGSPAAPSIPDDALVLAEVYVSASVTTISNGDITDSRVEAGLIASDWDAILDNDEALQSYNTSDTLVNLIKMNSSNQVDVGKQGYLTRVFSNCSFMAYPSANFSIADGATIVLNTEDHDIGGVYNTSNGKFTAPTKGIYLIGCNVGFTASVSGERYGYILKINGAQSRFITRPFAAATSPTYSIGVFLVPLNANDTLELEADVDSTRTVNATFTAFYGTLISARE